MPAGQSHLAGLGNTIADMDGTEIVLESTGNGIGNAFHLMWQEAEAGRGEYIAIFVPWYWQDEYRAPVKADFTLDTEGVKYQQAYGLDMEQMQWRANKISTYGEGFAWLFDQEYPGTASLAFQTSTQNPLISPSDVMAAVNSTFREGHAPLIIGCDPAGDGPNDADRTAIAIIIDKGGLGAGVYDRLTEQAIPVIGINNASRAMDSERYENIRAEMWWTMLEWLEDQPCRIPNNAALISDITAPQPKESSNGRKLVEKKKDMKTRGLRSCDGADALALTFAEPIASRSPELSQYRHRSKPAATIAGY